MKRLSIAFAAVAALSVGIGIAVYSGGAGSLRAAQAVPRSDGGWFMAADVQGPGLDGPNDVGVWAIGHPSDIGSAGPIVGIDGVAREFSDWGADLDVSGLREQAGVLDARACTGAALG